MSSPLANLTSLERRFVIGVMVVVFIVLNLLFVRPRFQDWGKVQLRLATANKTLEKYRTEIGEAPKLQTNILQIEKGGMTVPTDQYSVDFMKIIVNASIQTGVNIQTQQRSTTTSRTNDQFFVEQSQQLILIAREENLVNFLYQLSSGNNALISVRDLLMRPDQPRQQLSATLKLVANYQKTTPAKPGTAGSTSAATTASSTRNR